METFMSRRQSPSPHSLHWARDFATRQATSYHGQDNRLKIAANGSILDEFFNSCNVDLSPPQRHELLKRFLNSAGARSFPEAAKSGPRDKRVLAIVDDRCDPFTQFTNTPGSTGFLPVRQWESEEYMRRPPEGLHVRIAGGDADMLFYHLNKDVRLSMLIIVGKNDTDRCGQRKGVAERRIVYVCQYISSALDTL
ncbi:hypothetical protein EYZ11_001897 [Aspergillus tanneri]|uniref:Uncharacterized protein n=1 Tax=Aspergillus tanneri TaxID=1220188 RepID=A0A4S3JS35_9EURO|nr:hypothetical protein EYZ11_001897 [Aspergillus tanneri]